MENEHSTLLPSTTMVPPRRGIFLRYSTPTRSFRGFFMRVGSLAAKWCSRRFVLFVSMAESVFESAWVAPKLSSYSKTSSGVSFMVVLGRRSIWNDRDSVGRCGQCA